MHVSQRRMRRKTCENEVIWPATGEFFLHEVNIDFMIFFYQFLEGRGSFGGRFLEGGGLIFDNFWHREVRKNQDFHSEKNFHYIFDK